MTLTLPARGEAFIRSFEGCRLKAYLPTPDDVPTIGWGTTGSDVKLGMTWTQKQADERFAIDSGRFASRVAFLIKRPANQNQFDAMVSLAYNIGIANFGSSTLLKLHNAGDYVGAQKQFARWNKQKGKVLNGLTRRREAEAKLYGEKP